MATAKKAPARKKAPRKAPVRKTAAARKSTATKTAEPKLKQSAEKALHIYLGIIGKGIDTLQENVESMRKDNRKKRLQEYEKRGVKLRKELTKRWEKLDVAEEFEDAVSEAKGQFNKLQDQFEDVVETAKDKYNAAKAA